MSQLKRVLFVDDEPHVLAGLRRLLRGQRERWEMLFAEGGEQALTLLEQKPCDVVVSDMRMPGMDGAELLTKVASLYPRSVRLVLSGQSDQEHILRAVGPAHQFLTKPCAPDVLVKTIEDTCVIQEHLHSDSLRLLVGRLTALPSLPDVYQKLLEEIHRSEPNVERIGKLISSDLGMTALVLKLVSSSFFGLPTHITNAEHAVALLGLNILRPLVLTAHLFSYYKSTKIEGLSLESMMLHGVAVGTAARAILQQEQMPMVQADNGFLAGTLHDIGKLIFAANLGEEYVSVLRDARDRKVALHIAEESAFGATHAEVGGYLLGLWGLPAEIVEAVTFHHHPRIRVPTRSMH